jgi:hypothetical protein
MDSGARKEALGSITFDSFRFSGLLWLAEDGEGTKPVRFLLFKPGMLLLPLSRSSLAI